MEKTITIAGRQYKQKACAKNLIIYRAQFNEDMMKAVGMLQGSGEDGVVIIERLDGMRLMQLVWTMLKTAEPETEPFEEWADKLDQFPVIDAYNETIELLTANITAVSDVKNADAAAEA